MKRRVCVVCLMAGGVWVAISMLWVAVASGAGGVREAPAPEEAWPVMSEAAVREAAERYLQARSCALAAVGAEKTLAEASGRASSVLGHEKLIMRGKLACWRRQGERPAQVTARVTFDQVQLDEPASQATAQVYVYTTTTLLNARGQTRQEGEGIRHTLALALSDGQWVITADEYLDTAELAYLGAAGASAAERRGCVRRLAASHDVSVVGPGLPAAAAADPAPRSVPRYVTKLTYNRAAVVTYADRWTSESDITGIPHNGAKYNPAYYDYASNGGPGDCTPYASQCIFAGGYPYLLNWYYDKNPFKASPSWYNNNPQRSYLNGKYFDKVASVTGLAKGDIIYYDWNADGYLDHTAVYVGMYNGIRCIDAHTSDHKHHSWDLGAARTHFYHMKDSIIWPVPGQ